jgi:hypothetical protein
MQAAVAIIDKVGSADAVGAHLDLAICRLTGLIARHGSTPAPTQRQAGSSSAH